jgi:hypothetical protein
LAPGFYDGVAAADVGPHPFGCRVALDPNGLAMCDARLERSADGSFSGAATWSGLTASVRRSTAAPALQLAPNPNPAQRPNLPWTPIGVVFGNGDAIDWTQFTSGLTIRTDRSAAITGGVSPAPTPTIFTAWAGTFGASVGFAWDDVIGSTVTFQATGLTNYAGITAPALSTTAVIPDLGPTVAAQEFAGSSVATATWGPVAAAPGHPGCDSRTGCLALGPPLVTCEAGTAGLLAVPPGATLIKVRARRFRSGPVLDVGLRIRAYAETGATSEMTTWLLPEYDPATTPSGDPIWLGDWMTASIGVPAGVTASRVGFELAAVTLSCDVASGILVDWIKAE